MHRFVVEHSIEENVHALGRQRAAAMDLHTACPGSPSKRAAVAAAKEGEALTVRDVAVLLSNRWSERHIDADNVVRLE